MRAEICAVLVLLACSHSGTGVQEAVRDGTEIVLIDLEASAVRPEGEVRPRSLDERIERTRARYYVPRLEACGDVVSRAGARWAASTGFRAVQSERSRKRVVVHFARRGMPGFLELLYLVDEERKMARARFTLFGAGGQPSAPELEGTLSTSAFASELKRALTCLSRSSS